MRLTIFALAMLPFGAHAQSTLHDTLPDPVQNDQSCAVGMVWDFGSQTCIIDEQTASPLQNLPGGHDCGYEPRSVTS